MELTVYLRILRRWIWLILLAAFIAGAINFILVSSRPPSFRTSTTVIIGNPTRNPDTNYTELLTSQDLTQTYARLLQSYTLLEGVVSQLSLPMSPERLQSMISTRTVVGTSLLEIEVTYTDPIIAADIANAVAEALIDTSPTNNLSEEQQAQIAVANAEINELNRQIANLRQELQIVDNALQNETDLNVRSQLNEQRTTLTDQINETNANVIGFNNFVTSLQQSVGSIEVVDLARVPTSPSGASVSSRVALAAMIGAILTMGGVLAYEYLNDTIQSATEATNVLRLPVLGVIGRIGNNKKDTYQGRLILDLPPLSQTVEQYQNLRTNLMFVLTNTAAIANKVIVVTSPSASEGKSTTAANLAISLARAGQRVLLIDADLRRPKVHELFGLPNERGLSTMLSGNPLDSQSGSKLDFSAYDGIRDFIHETPVRGLQVITSGFIPVNPGEILGSALLKRWVKSFRDSPNVDVIIFDSPPSLAISDSRVLAGAINGKVLMVLEANRTHRRSAQQAIERFQYIDDTIVGLVLNNVAPGFEDYYGYDYSYYLEDYKSTTGAVPKQPVR